MPYRPIAARKPRHGRACGEPDDDTRRRAGCVVGGILLNQNLEFIDTINDLVYQSGQPAGRAARERRRLFLDDVRISTNVRLFEGRARTGDAGIGRGPLCRDGVRGRTWLDSASWSTTGTFRPTSRLVDTYAQGGVGMLYVGFLQKTFNDAKFETRLIIALAIHR
jgi:hypothetical protein